MFEIFSVLALDIYFFLLNNQKSLKSSKETFICAACFLSRKKNKILKSSGRANEVQKLLSIFGELLIP